MSLHDISGIEALRAKSSDDPQWFWPAVIDFLDIRFGSRWDDVVDESAGPAWATWFNGARLNAVEQCLDRHAESRPQGVALKWEGEDGAARSWTWAELQAQSDGVALLLRRRGVVPGDVVGIFMPMIPETVAAVLGIIKLGAVFLPLFSGYGAEAIRIRLEDSRAVALVTADGFLRRGKAVPMIETAVAAASDSIRTIVVADRVGSSLPRDDRLISWPVPASEPVDALMVGSEHPLFIAYTSGTTGKPKASVHVHGGFLVKVAEEVAFQFDAGPDDTLFWFTDMGWIMGPWEVIGGLANGTALALYEGAPDFPAADRLWQFCARHDVTILGVGPTLVRALMPHGDELVMRHDLTRLRVLGSTGEAWNETPWRWYFEVVGGGKAPVINISGGTEVGACFLSPHPVEEIAPMSLGGPALGMAMDVVDQDGHPVRDTVGELVCRRPWPSMTRGLLNDRERYIETYWSRWPDLWAHGDWASVEDGQWYLHGRSDDTIKVAGKRLGPAEVESSLVAHPLVMEAAAIGVPDETKGEALWVYVVLTETVADLDELKQDLRELVVDALGRAFSPSRVLICDSLPKTRNAKILRRAIRNAALGKEPGDLSALENPAALDDIRQAR